MALKACSECGSQLLDEDTVCGVCGAKMGGEAVPHHKKVVPGHYVFGPTVAIAGFLSLWLGIGIGGIAILGLGLALTLFELSDDPFPDIPFGQGWSLAQWLIWGMETEEKSAIGRM